MTAWDIECFQPAEEYNASIESLVARLHASGARPGSGQVTLPGDRSAATRAERGSTGIPMTQDVVDECAVVAERAGVVPPRPK